MLRNAFRRVIFYQKCKLGTEQGEGNLAVLMSMPLTFHVLYYPDAVAQGPIQLLRFKHFIFFQAFVIYFCEDTYILGIFFYALRFVEERDPHLDSIHL